MLSLSQRVGIFFSFAQSHPFQLLPQPVLQCQNLETTIGIGRQVLNFRVVLAVPALILFVILVVRTIRLFTELETTSISNVASQAIELEIVPS